MHVGKQGACGVLLAMVAGSALAADSSVTDFITFRYDAERRAWLFNSEIFTSSDPLNGTPDKTDVTHANRTKPVAFEAWRPAR